MTVPYIDALKKLADEGDVRSQYALGNAYTTGTKGVIKNETKATEYWHKAEQQGHVEATYALAGAYQSGMGVRRNRETAEQYRSKAAHRGLVRAQILMGHQADTKSRENNDSRYKMCAYVWYSVAAASGSGTAYSEANKMEKKLSQSEINSARREAQELLDKINGSK